VEQSIPSIEKQLADLRAEVLSFQQDLGGDAASGIQPPVTEAMHNANPTKAVPLTMPAASGAAAERQPKVSFANSTTIRPEARIARTLPAASNGLPDTPVAMARTDGAVGQGQKAVVRHSPLQFGKPGVHFQRVDRTLTSKKQGGKGKPQVHFAKVVKAPVVRGRAYIPSGEEALAMALKQAAMAAARMNGEAYEPGSEEEDGSAVNYPGELA
jgi:hypothetical protein